MLRPGQAVRENRAAFPLPFIYYFGDWDKHGVNISNDIERKLNGFGANVSFERVTVLPWQIEDWQLPTRPTKDVGWGDCVEVDAMPANKLRELVTEVIEEHIDEESYQETLRIEKLEKKTFDEVVNNWGVASNSHKGTNVGQLVQLMEPNNEGDASE